MKVQVERLEGVTVATVAGDTLDAATAPEFRCGVGSALAGSPRVLLDLSQVMFVDSSGLGAILACFRELNVEGGQLRLAGVNPPVQRVFELVRLHKIIEYFPTRSAAVANWP